MSLIFLSGASSAGKTTIAVELGRRLGDTCRLVGLDAELRRHRFPLAFRRNSFLMAVLDRAEAEVAARKLVVVDAALLTEAAVRRAEQMVDRHGGLLVGVKPPLEISEEWEELRGNRERGHARRNYTLVHTQLQPRYDLIIDSSQVSPAEAAAAILTAYRQLSR